MPPAHQTKLLQPSQLSSSSSCPFHGTAPLLSSKMPLTAVSNSSSSSSSWLLHRRSPRVHVTEYKSVSVSNEAPSLAASRRVRTLARPWPVVNVEWESPASGASRTIDKSAYSRDVPHPCQPPPPPPPRSTPPSLHKSSTLPPPSPLSTPPPHRLSSFPSSPYLPSSPSARARERPPSPLDVPGRENPVQSRGRSRDPKGSVRLLKARAAAARSGSQAPALSISSLATDSTPHKTSVSSFSPTSSTTTSSSVTSGHSRLSRPASSRRSLSRSRLLACVGLSTMRQTSTEYYKEDKTCAVEDYLSSPISGSAAAAATSPGLFNHYTLKTAAVSGGRSAPRSMGRTMRVVVTGAKKVGKTAILRQVACIEDITSIPYSPTMDDTYQVLLEEGDRPREIICFHDTAGVSDQGPVELKRPYIQVADAFVLVYSVADHESFNRVDMLKKLLDKQFGKEKKEVPIVVLGNMTDLPGRKVDSEFALNWSNREKVKLFEVTATERNSLIDFVHYLGQKHFHPQKESKFSLSKRLKAEKSNSAILMDI